MVPMSSLGYQPSTLPFWKIPLRAKVTTGANPFQSHVSFAFISLGSGAVLSIPLRRSRLAATRWKISPLEPMLLCNRTSPTSTNAYTLGGSSGRSLRIVWQKSAYIAPLMLAELGLGSGGVGTCGRTVMDSLAVN